MLLTTIRLAATVLLLAVATLVACQTNGGPSNTVAPRAGATLAPFEPAASVSSQSNQPDAITDHDVDPGAIVIGLDADMSSGSAESGEAIRRGIVLAMDEINTAGGVLGRPMQLLVRDHRGNPARGVDNLKELGEIENLVAVVGGLHTPVALEELETIHRLRIIYLDPWAAGTLIIDNGYEPNYAFRVSVRDEYAGEFLIAEALKLGFRRPALLLEQTGWGRSNHQAMTKALTARGLEPAGVEWFHWGVQANEMADLVAGLTSKGADVIMLVANAPEGIAVVRAVATLPEEVRLPIVSHWGITGGRLYKETREALPQVDLRFLQTYSFIDPPFPDRANKIVDAYCGRFPGCYSAESIFSPVGTAHAYELVHLLRLALDKAGTTDRAAVRDALESLGPYQGLIRNYSPPFTPDRHDALTASDFSLARYSTNGVIIPGH